MLRSSADTLARFTRDLTAEARAGRLEPVRCRDNEIARRDTPERAEAWVRKAAAYGLRQANGTRRHAGITPRL